MKCDDIQKELEAYLSDDIDEPRKSEIKNHLDDCQDCSRVLRHLTGLSEVLHTWEEIEPSPIMYEKVKSRMKDFESPWRRVFTYAFAKKAAFRFAGVAAVVALTLFINQLLQKPAPQVGEELAPINIYLKEHQEAAAQTVSAELSTQPAARVSVGREDVLYYEFVDKFPIYTRPGLIIWGPTSRQEIRLPEVPAISRGRVLSLLQALEVVDFEPVVPQRLPHDYILESIKKIDEYDSLHLVYSNGIDTLSLFEQPSHGRGGLVARDFREYAVYRSQESDADSKEQQRRTILAWSNGTLSFVLVGKMDMSRMMDIVQSIKGNTTKER